MQLKNEICEVLIKLKRMLIEKKIKISNGMSEKEIKKVEKIYQIVFPKDYKEILKEFVLDCNNWRDISEKNISYLKDKINAPIEGIIFDIENNGFWMNEFGNKPKNIQERVNIFLKYIEKNNIPKLIPILNNTYMICDENSEYPIVSVIQKDIIILSNNLINYFEQKLNISKQNELYFRNIKIPFWSNIINCNYEDLYMVTSLKTEKILEIFYRVLYNKGKNIDYSLVNEINIFFETKYNKEFNNNSSISGAYFILYDYLKEYKQKNSPDEYLQNIIDEFLSSTSNEWIEAYEDISSINN